MQKRGEGPKPRDAEKDGGGEKRRAGDLSGNQMRLPQVRSAQTHPRHLARPQAGKVHL